MLSEKWRARRHAIGRFLFYTAIVIYLLVLLYDIDSIQSGISSIESDVSSIQSDVDSIHSDVSSIEDGSCSNNRICP
jgi:hypothetical protein